MIVPLDPRTDLPPDVIGAKAHGLITLMRLGLPVPPGFVLTVGTAPPAAAPAGAPGAGAPSASAPSASAPSASAPSASASEACASGPAGAPGARASGPADTPGAAGAGPHAAADELPADLDAAVAQLGAESVSVRSGAAVSMPGMMDTVLDVRGPVAPAVRTVFASWHTPRAVTYRELRNIPHDLGTAVIVQAMVHGDRDPRSGSGVAFSRDPATGAPHPYGDVLFGHRGDAVVSGRFNTSPLSTLADREPAVWSALTAALTRVEQHYRDACHVEFTFETGRLWLLQVRPGGLTPRAAIRVAVDLADAGLISRAEAIRRITPSQLRAAATPRMLIPTTPATSPAVNASTQDPDAALSTPAPGAPPGPASAPGDPDALSTPAPGAPPGPTSAPGDLGACPIVKLSRHGLAATPGAAGLLARGRGASPGVATGRVALTADAAVRMRGPVVLVRPETSPLDMHGLAAAVGVVTARGGLASHAAVVARSLNKPAVVGAYGLDQLTEGIEITIDGTSGEIARGAQPTTTAADDPHLARLLTWADTISGDDSPRPAEARLTAALARL